MPVSRGSVKRPQEEENMTELELKYGCNPNQKPSRIFVENGELPIKVLNGKPGYINFLDAFTGLVLRFKSQPELRTVPEFLYARLL